MSLSAGSWSGAAQCEVRLADGAKVMLGNFWLDDGYGAWGVALASGTGRITSASVVTPRGVLASASFASGRTRQGRARPPSRALEPVLIGAVGLSRGADGSGLVVELVVVADSFGVIEQHAGLDRLDEVEGRLVFVLLVVVVDLAVERDRVRRVRRDVWVGSFAGRGRRRTRRSPAHFGRSPAASGRQQRPRTPGLRPAWACRAWTGSASPSWRRAFP